MTSRSKNILTTCGREAGPLELEHAQEVVKLCAGLSRSELASTLCEHWGWVGPTGGLQRRACAKLIERWEKEGHLRLPVKSVRKPPRQVQACEPAATAGRTAEREPVACTLAEIQPVWLEVVSGREATALWTEFVNRYHPLKSKKTIGCTLRYFICSERGRLGCLLLGCAAVALAVRDRWIGWSRQERLAHLPWVINNQRLLLFPWVRVPHLVSHVLGQLARRVQGDWEARWGYRPVLLETFVDPEQYRGVGYRAAGWQLLGESTGRGICRGQHAYRTTPKMIFAKPLALDFRARLCSTGAMATRCEQPDEEQEPLEADKPVVDAPPGKRSGSGEKSFGHTRRL